MASDLRPGLPWQGVEIHEPVRLLFVIETTPEAMISIMDRNQLVGNILRNGWAQLAVLDPHSYEIQVFRDNAFHVYQPERTGDRIGTAPAGIGIAAGAIIWALPDRAGAGPSRRCSKRCLAIRADSSNRSSGYDMDQEQLIKVLG